jgi:hypothetical protein
MVRATVIASAFCAVLMVAPQVCAAGDSEAGAAAAESLFQQGRKLMDANRYGEACPKFAASHKIAPAIGTLLNLADCYERNNQLASAWARFHEAIALAQRLGRTNREQTARARADKLEPRLIKLSIASHTPSAVVTLDGNPIEAAALGVPIPVDAGKHTVEASAKGKKPFATTIETTEKQKAPSLDIPALEDEPRDTKDAVSTEPPKEESGRGSTQRTIGLIAAGVGVVGLGVGGYFGLRSSNLWTESEPHCPGNECDDEGYDLATRAKNAGNIAAVSAIAGGALVVGGAILFFTAPSGRPRSALHPPLRVGIGPGSLMLGGTF